MTPPTGRSTQRPTAVVALGASAGGLQSLGEVLGGLNESFPAPILVALHLDPDHRSQAVLLLQRRTRLRVRVARSGARVQAGVVYVAPPDHHLELRAGKLRLTQAQRVSYSRPSIDVLFSSVAADSGPGAVVAILSGTGSDGAAGLADIKARGGLAVAEDLSTAGFSGMPTAARRTGLLDAVLPVRQIPPFLTRAVARRVTVSQRQWQSLLTKLEKRTGTRFANYRSSTLHRRLQQRIAARGAHSMASYLRLLDRDSAEVDRLQAAFLIKVSSFARDAVFWRVLARELPRVKSGKAMRAWSAGCATGEEAYSLALRLAHQWGTGPDVSWKVFATDIDAGALQAARQGRYRADQLRGVSAADRVAYFVQEGDLWRVGKALRSRVVFGRHDLLHDPPLTDMDLLACRNVLIYFTAPQRRRILQTLGQAIRPEGILFLGRSEELRPVAGFERIGHTSLFRKTTLHPAMAKAAKGRKSGASRTPSSTRRSHRPGSRANPSAAGAQQDLNEELQSRNEELETVNEELQSLNDELSTVEEQMRGLSEESQRTNDFLRLVLDTSTEAIVACDGADHITYWSKVASKRFRLSATQAVGGNLFDLVPALDAKGLRKAIRTVLAARGQATQHVGLEGTTCRVDALAHGSGKGRGYVLRVAAPVD